MTLIFVTRPWASPLYVPRHVCPSALGSQNLAVLGPQFILAQHLTASGFRGGCLLKRLIENNLEAVLSLNRPFSTIGKSYISVACMIEINVDSKFVS